MGRKKIEDILSDFRASGQSSKSYCQAHGYNERTFRTWKKQYGVPSSEKVSRLVPLQISGLATEQVLETPVKIEPESLPSKGFCYEVEFPGGLLVRLSTVNGAEALLGICRQLNI